MFTLLCVIIVTTDPVTQSAEELLVLANQAYELGDYVKAASLYDGIIRDSGGTGYIYYNLGNASLRAGKLGQAVAAYMQAQGLRPRDQDIAANLSFARQSIKDAVPPPEASALLRALFFWHFVLSRDELGVLGVLTNVLFWLCLFFRRIFWRETLGWGAVVALLTTLALGGSYATRTVWPTRRAVISIHEANVYAGTSEDGLVRFKLLEGTETRLIDTQDAWLRIALSDGNQGWLKAEVTRLVVY